MIKLANGTEVSEDVFYTWGALKQKANLDPDYSARMRRQNLGLKRTEQTRANIRASKIGRKRLRDGEHGKGKQIMTPDGLFDTIGLYCKHIDRTYNVVYKRMAREPNLYYYIKK